MVIDFDLLESEAIRLVLRALGRETFYTWTLRHVHHPQQMALCTFGQHVIMGEERQGETVYQDAWRVVCPRIGGPAFDGRMLCDYHRDFYHPCVSCGRRPVYGVEPWDERCLRCVDLEFRRKLRVGAVPQRFQWRRAKGARTPVHAQNVTRTSYWGNPFEVVHQRSLLGKHYRQRSKNKQRAEVAVLLFEAYYEHNTTFRREVRVCLMGYDLKCFCPLDWPCHADVLLRWANERDD